MSGVGPVRLLLVDDDTLVRSGLRLMLGETEGIEVVGEAADGDEVPAAVAAHRPDVVLMDLRMRRVDGIRATAELRRGPDAPVVLVLTTFETDADILGALRAGATGYLVKDTPPVEIEAAILRAAAGEPSLSPTVTRRLVAAATGGPDAGDASAAAQRATTRLAVLSDQESAVAAAVGRGWNNARIAAELHLSLSTVKTYLSAALAKLDLDNRTQLALLAHEAGLPRREGDAPGARADG